MTSKVGNYITKLTLNPGYVWDDGVYSQDPKQLAWTINPLVAELS